MSAIAMAGLAFWNDCRALARQGGTRRIEIGEQRGPLIVVRSGLAEGDRVIVSWLQKVRPGITVEATEVKADTTAK
jgi:hypothetical protein